MYSAGKGVVLLLTLITNNYRLVDGTTNITNMENLHTALLTGYNKDVRPIDNQTQVLNVTFIPYLRSIQGLDEVTGELSFTGAIAMSWIDSKITWNPATYGGIDFIYLSYESIWVPGMIMTTSTDESDTFSKKWQKVKYNQYGSAGFVVGGRYLASCNVDVENYPFDKQTCKVRFTAWGYDSTELGVIAGKTTVDTEQFGGHNVWKLTKTETETYVLQNWPYFNMNFYLERKSGFTLVSLISPLLFMNFLNVLVFLLVPESGERVSYSVTVLLAIAVFMTIISDALPPSSDPIPRVTYKLMTDMIISVLITMITILNLSLYHKEDDAPVPRRVKAIYRFFHSCFRENETSFGKTQVGIAHDDNSEGGDVKSPAENESGNVQDNDITWKKISFMVDYISLVVFSSASVLTFVVFVSVAST